MAIKGQKQGMGNTEPNLGLMAGVVPHSCAYSPSGGAARKSTKPEGAEVWQGMGQSDPASGHTPRLMLFNRRDTLSEVGLNKHGKPRAVAKCRADRAPHLLQ